MSRRGSPERAAERRASSNGSPPPSSLGEGADEVPAELVFDVGVVGGNIDRDGPCSRLPETDVLLFEGHYLYLLHDLGTLRLDPVAAKFSAVLYGHSHRPSIDRRKGVLYFNPGSCGPRRFDLSPTIGTLTFESGTALRAEIVRLISSSDS